MKRQKLLEINEKAETPDLNYKDIEELHELGLNEEEISYLLYLRSKKEVSLRQE